MNEAQRLWWSQANSDFKLFVKLHKEMDVVEQCHLLHYVQMSTDKLSKAYLWRTGEAPPKTHTGFVAFLRALAARKNDLPRIVALLGFPNEDSFCNWVKAVQPLAYELQKMAPSEAGDGPNPEYPGHIMSR